VDFRLTAVNVYSVGNSFAGDFLSSSHDVGVPFPVGCVLHPDLDVGSVPQNVSTNVVDGQSTNGQVTGGISTRSGVEVVTDDDNTDFTDVLENDVVESDSFDNTFTVEQSLDSDTDVVLDDLAILDDNVFSFVDIVSTNSDSDTVASFANVVLEEDVGSRVDGQAIVLVVNLAVLDSDVMRLGYIKTVGIVAPQPVSISIVNSDPNEVCVVTVIDGKDVFRGVFDRQTIHSGMFQLHVNTVGLNLSAVSSEDVPPTMSLSIDQMSRFSFNSQSFSLDDYKRSLPFHVTECDAPKESDLGSWFQILEVQSLTCRNVNVPQNDVFVFGFSGSLQLLKVPDVGC